MQNAKDGMRPPVVCLSSPRRSDAAKFDVELTTLVKGQPSAHTLCLARRTIRNLWIGMHTRARRVGPGALARLPSRNDPTVTRFIAAGHEWFLEYLVVRR